MSKYELTLILDPKATLAKKKKVQGIVEKIADQMKGKIIKSDDWGVKDFAYDINKKSSGAYLFFELELDSSSAKSLNEKLRLENEILRYLFVKSS
jgi:small subunit ribosomal protein S6